MSLKNGVFLTGNEYLTDSCLFTQYHFSIGLSTIVLKLFSRLAMRRWGFDGSSCARDDDYDKLLVKVLSNLVEVVYWECLSPCFVGPSQWPFEYSSTCREVSFDRYRSPWYLTLSTGTLSNPQALNGLSKCKALSLTLAQTQVSNPLDCKFKLSTGALVLRGPYSCEP